MGNVDGRPASAAASQPRAIVETLRVVCLRNGRCTLCDGTPVSLRLIDPSDLPACYEMLSLCTRKSLYSRYERVVNEPLEELAAQLCRPDYESELTVVAETCENGANRLLGIAQLLAAPSHDAAEYAVLVADPWQSKGLGSAFTDTCLRLAHVWGIDRVVVEFLPGNMRMIRILERRAFDLVRDMQEHAVSGQKNIDRNDASPPSGDAPAAGGRRDGTCRGAEDRGSPHGVSGL